MQLTHNSSKIFCNKYCRNKKICWNPHIDGKFELTENKNVLGFFHWYFHKQREHDPKKIFQIASKHSFSGYYR